MIDHIYKYPRLYLNAPFAKNAKISLREEHIHYLRNVLRKGNGDELRLFNGVDGEWLGALDDLGKKKGSVVLGECFKEQPTSGAELHLFFSPIKKQRMDFLIEKAVELGVSGLHPVLMNRTESRKVNENRIHMQIIEAAEQCERMDVPVLYPMQLLSDILVSEYDYPIYACVERNEASCVMAQNSYNKGAGFIIGPEGGFDPQECMMIEQSKYVRSLYLGDTILRAETAALTCLSYAKLSTIT
ncbi:MAG: RsmE family RNA methyltransferase [Alphaproteobacteria bacterium]